MAILHVHPEILANCYRYFNYCKVLLNSPLFWDVVARTAELRIWGRLSVPRWSFVDLQSDCGILTNVCGVCQLCPLGFVESITILIFDCYQKTTRSFVLSCNLRRFLCIGFYCLGKVKRRLNGCYVGLNWQHEKWRGLLKVTNNTNDLFLLPKWDCADCGVIVEDERQ